MGTITLKFRELGAGDFCLRPGYYDIQIKPTNEGFAEMAEFLRKCNAHSSEHPGVFFGIWSSEYPENNPHQIIFNGNAFLNTKGTMSLTMKGSTDET